MRGTNIKRFFSFVLLIIPIITQFVIKNADAFLLIIKRSGKKKITNGFLIYVCMYKDSRIPQTHIKKPFLKYDFAPAPFQFSIYTVLYDFQKKFYRGKFKLFYEVILYIHIILSKTFYFSDSCMPTGYPFREASTKMSSSYGMTSSLISGCGT
jgi:hypothetical protein